MCAVAFWGAGAADVLKHCNPNAWQRAKIVCDISMGSTNPRELQELGAPTNKQLRFKDGLHSKVYISERGLVVASANVSSNGIGFGAPASLIEAGTVHSRDSLAWEGARQWFEKLHGNADHLCQSALDRAWKNWRPEPNCKEGPKALRYGSVIDVVQQNSEKFEDIGFVFVNKKSNREAAENAQKELKQSIQLDIGAVGPANFFSGWKPSEIRRWPTLFFEFWLGSGGPKVYAREVIIKMPNQGFLYSSGRAWPAIKASILSSIIWPTPNEINSADEAIAKKIIRSYSNGVLFKSRELCDVIYKMNRL